MTCVLPFFLMSWKSPLAYLLFAVVLWVRLCLSAERRSEEENFCFEIFLCYTCGCCLQERRKRHRLCFFFVCLSFTFCFDPDLKVLSPWNRLLTLMTIRDWWSSWLSSLASAVFFFFFFATHQLFLRLPGIPNKFIDCTILRDQYPAIWGRSQ